jgi:hypothetical protein
MLDGINLSLPGSPREVEIGSAREMALIFMKDRANKIQSMETYLVSKALFISGTDDIEGKNKQIGEYNKLLTEYQDLVNPAKIADRKKFERSFKQQAKDLSGKTMNDILGGKKLKLGKKHKDNFSKTLTTKNWGKVN